MTGYPVNGLITLSDFYGKSNAFSFTISTSTYNPDVRALAITAGWNSTAPLIVNITAPLINTLDLGTAAFTNGITLNISAATRVGGQAFGGVAFKTRVAVTVNNLGIFSGGGGGGGNGSSAYVTYFGETVVADGGSGGNAQGFAGNTLGITAVGSGGSGRSASYRGPIFGGDTPPWVQAADGGSGGAWGQAGESGQTYYSAGGSYYNAGIYSAGGSGGQAGAGVDGMAYITWVNQGTIIGPKI